ncbi:kinase-like protein [Calocera viscosa TUFC12733]|uniref:Kinase-like protein n=1 Tax=Calocera viscosa (strain TUFC12733) TaxID=1330018 RepID=A0A167N8H6_CALVF|nr:kinase-like protein [Calocera viscosa TUFC12733]
MEVSNTSSCVSCSARKWRCNGAHPVCAGCQQQQVPCCYDWSLDKGIFELFPTWSNLNWTLNLERRAQQAANGGFARVYRTHTKTGHLVAVKVFFDHKRPPARALELSVREAFTWHRLQHPNIVPLLGIADYAKICPGGFPQLCLVSPWIPDGNIMDYLKANPSVSPLRLLVHIVDAVAYLHSFRYGSIIHGDLKGNNILIDCRMFDGSPTARLIDFGLSQIQEAGMADEVGTTSSGFNGNARWMAFERIRPERYGLRQSESKSTKSDIFELARTFFEILTGGPPFHGKSDFSAVTEAYQGSNPERSTVCPWIDDDRWKLMLKCWSPDREARPSLQAIRQDLDDSIWLDPFLREREYVDLGFILRGGTTPRRLVALRERITAVEFPLYTVDDDSLIHELEGLLPQLDIHVLRFCDLRRTPPEKGEAILKLTPSLQHLELDARSLSRAIDCAPFLDMAHRHAPHLTTLILRNVPTTFGGLSSLLLRNLEVRMNVNQSQSTAQRVLAFCQLLERTPSLERLVLQDWGAHHGAEASYLPALPSPQLLRLRCFHLDAGNAMLASEYLVLVSRSNLTELSFKILPYRSLNIDPLRAWPQLKVLGLPSMRGINAGVFNTVTALEDLECDTEDFLDLLSVVPRGTTIFPGLHTLRIRSAAGWWPGDGSIARFLRARDDAGIPLQRLLVHEDAVTRFFEVEPDLGGVNVQIGRYRPRDGFEGVTAALEPVDDLFSEAELRKYGL